MSLPVVFRRAARAEFDDAANWYEQRSARRGALFSVAVRQVLDRIADQPRLYAEVFQDVREAPVPGYPYCVYYRPESSQLVVLAVFHASRDPSIWQGRA
jgi:plasmid stabilization system protein ParE